MIRPGRGLGAGGFQHPFAEFDDQAGILRHGNEFGGRDHAAFGMAPAQQGLAAGHLVAVKVDQRLVVDFEAAIHQRLTQVLLHGKPRLRAGVHRGFEEAMGSASAGLGAIHRQIGVLDQLIQLGAVLRRQCNADAGVGRELMTEALIGLPDRLVNSGDEFHDIADVPDAGLDHRKLVTAEPRDQIGLAEAAADAAGHRLQQFIADMVPERVVDALELVDVDIEQRELLALAGSLQLALDLFAEQHPVRQVGQRVVMREVRDLLVGAPALGNIVDDVDQIPGFTGLVRNSDAL